MSFPLPYDPTQIKVAENVTCAACCKEWNEMYKRRPGMAMVMITPWDRMLMAPNSCCHRARKQADSSSNKPDDLKSKLNEKIEKELCAKRTSS